MAKVDDNLVRYYQDELSYLRHSGAEFAKLYPKIAQRLELNGNESTDPHVERLLESFAFLTARLSKAIDDRFPQTAQALLSILYPHLIQPVPSMAIAKLEIDESQIAPDKGAILPKGTTLLARSIESVQCRFQTVYDTHLWPITVQAAQIIATESLQFQKSIETNWCLSITLQSKEAPFSKMALNEIVFHLTGDAARTNALYETLFCENTGEMYLTTSTKTPCEGGITVEPVGFSRNEVGLPLPEHSLHHYALFQEYFHFSDKFLFVRFKGLQSALRALSPTQKIQLIIPLKNPQIVLQKGIDASFFTLNCVPIINLFERPSDPIHINHRHLKYRVIPDIRRERTTEIYAVKQVDGVEEKTQRPITFLPYYSLEGHQQEADNYWITQRQPAILRGVPGTDVHISFVDRTFNAIKSKDIVATAKLLCTNRYLAEQLPNNAILSPEDKAPVLKVTLLNKPRGQIYSPSDGESLWMIISQLSVNYLSIVNASENLKALKELLFIFANRYPEISATALHALKEISVEKCVRRFGQDAWRGFVQGFKVNITIKKNPEEGSSNLILSNILHQYFSAIAHWNSFVETHLLDPNLQTPWMIWQPIPGQQIQL